MSFDLLLPYLPIIVALFLGRLSYGLVRGGVGLLSVSLPLLGVAILVLANLAGQSLPGDAVLMTASVGAVLGSISGSLVALVVGIFVHAR